MSHAFLAGLVLLVHFGIVVFVVAGLPLIVAGNLCGWQWVNLVWFRLAHLAAIAVVVAEAWLGITCPLTTLESWLRLQAGLTPHDQGFVEHWVQRALYYQAPAWVFTSAYTLFGLLVAGVWWRWPPRWQGAVPPSTPEARRQRSAAS